MQIKTNTAAMNTDGVLEKLITVVISAAVGWLISSFSKVSTASLEKTIGELEKRVIGPIAERLGRIESKAEGFVTRSEMKEVVADLKVSMEARQVEIRGTLNALFREMRQIHGARRQTGELEDQEL